MAITPEQKLHKQQKANLLTTVNRLKSQFSFGNIKTWNDVYRIVGYSSEYIQKNYNEKVDKPVTITYLRSFIDKLNKDLEELQNRKVEDVKQIPPIVVEELSQTGDVNNTVKQSNEDSSRVQEISHKTATTETKSSLPPSPQENQKLSLYYFQKEAALKILQGYEIYDK